MIAVFSLSVSTGELIGPFMGGVLYDKFDFSIAYFASFMIMLTVLTLVLLFARSSWVSGRPSKPSSEGTVVEKEPTWKLLKSTNLRNAMIISGLVLYSKDLFVAYFPIYATNLGISSTRIGMILSAMAGMAIVVRISQYYLVHRFGRGKVMFAALFLSGVTYCSIPFVHWPIMLANTGDGDGRGTWARAAAERCVCFEFESGRTTRRSAGMRLMFNRSSQFGAPISVWIDRQRSRAVSDLSVERTHPADWRVHHKNEKGGATSEPDAADGK